MVAGLRGVDAMVGGGVGDAQGGAVDGAHQQPTDAHPSRWPWREPGHAAGRTAPAGAPGRGGGGPGSGPRRSGSPPGGRQGRHTGAATPGDSPARRTGSRPAADTPPPGRAGPEGGTGPAGGDQGRIDHLEGELLGELAQVTGGEPTRRHRDRAGDDRLFHSGAPVGVVLEDTPLYRSSAACSPTGQTRLDRPHRTLTTRHCGQGSNFLGARAGGDPERDGGVPEVVNAKPVQARRLGRRAPGPRSERRHP